MECARWHGLRMADLTLLARAGRGHHETLSGTRFPSRSAWLARRRFLTERLSRWMLAATAISNDCRNACTCALRANIWSRRSPSFTYVFDLLYCDGYDLRKSPLLERKQLLQSRAACVRAVSLLRSSIGERKRAIRAGGKEWSGRNPREANRQPVRVRAKPELAEVESHEDGGRGGRWMDRGSHSGASFWFAVVGLV